MKVKKTAKITLANTRIYETVKKSSFVSIYLQGNEIISNGNMQNIFIIVFRAKVNENHTDHKRCFGCLDDALETVFIYLI